VEEQLKLAKLQHNNNIEVLVNSATIVQIVVEVQPPTPKKVETTFTLAPPFST
jgi:hypothetical protein